MAKRIMRSFKMNEISAVDRPAQAHAKMTIMKRADARLPVTVVYNKGDPVEALAKFAHDDVTFKSAAVAKDMWGVSRFAELIQSINYLAQASARERDDEGDGSPIPDALKNWMRTGTGIFRDMADEEIRELVASVSKREFSASERRADAKSGVAMSDGSFPIADAGDLANAMRLAGHAKDPAKAKAHIKARAKALGLTSRLTDVYKREESMLNKAISFFKSFGEAKKSLAESVQSIVDDDTSTNKGEMIAETIKQFSAHVEGELEKTLSGGNPGGTSEDDVMSAALKKALGLADTATESDVLAAIAKKDAELAIAKAKMSAEEKAHHDSLESDDAKEKFRSMSSEERASRMKKRVEELHPDVRKALDENETLRKQVAALVAKDELETFKKRAQEIGVPVDKADTLMKASHGDKSAIEEVFAMMKTVTAALDGSAVFKEFGSNQSVQGDEVDVIKAKAAELRKADPKLSEEQAFAKAYADPANRKIAAAERAKNRPVAA